MRAKAGVTAIAGLAMLGLAACGSGSREPQLMNIRSTGGPDEFAILPPKPLQMPDSLSDLPAPTPGGENLTDPRPFDDAAVALGGKPQKQAGGVPSSDGGLYAYASRFGVQSGIRQTLADEDLDWRRDNRGRILERLFNVNVYYKAYKKFWLDQHAELAFWRRKGIRTPSAPPRKDGEE